MHQTVHQLHKLALDRVVACPYERCDKYFLANDKARMQTHLVEAHEAETCNFCDEPLYSHWSAEAAPEPLSVPPRRAVRQRPQDPPKTSQSPTSQTGKTAIARAPHREAAWNFCAPVRPRPPRVVQPRRPPAARLGVLPWHGARPSPPAQQARLPLLRPLRRRPPPRYPLPPPSTCAAPAKTKPCLAPFCESAASRWADSLPSTPRSHRFNCQGLWQHAHRQQGRRLLPLVRRRDVREHGPHGQASGFVFQEYTALPWACRQDRSAPVQSPTSRTSGRPR